MVAEGDGGLRTLELDVPYLYGKISLLFRVQGRTAQHHLVAAVWQGIGQPMILFLAGLQSVSTDVLEAATIDGAGPIKKFFRITVPLMKETFVMVIATLITAAMKVYDIVQGLTGGGPNNSTQMLATYMYSQTFQYNNVGMGTAVACVMFAMMMIVIVPYVAFTAKEK